jgi:hypothetical protein
MIRVKNHWNYHRPITVREFVPAFACCDFPVLYFRLSHSAGTFFLFASQLLGNSLERSIPYSLHSSILNDMGKEVKSSFLSYKSCRPPDPAMSLTTTFRNFAIRILPQHIHHTADLLSIFFAHHGGHIKCHVTKSTSTTTTSTQSRL